MFVGQEAAAEKVELTKEEQEKKARELEKLKAHLEKHYVFPDDPVVIVHPNRCAGSCPLAYCMLMCMCVCQLLTVVATAPKQDG